MSRYLRPAAVAIGAGLATAALVMGGGLPWAGTLTGGSVPASAGGAAGVATSCDTWETACEWNLAPLVVEPTGTDSIYLWFTAPKTGPFSIVSSAQGADADPFGMLYAADRQLLSADDDSGGLPNFRLTEFLTQGETYFLVVRHFMDTNFGTFTISFGEAEPCISIMAACPWDLSPLVMNDDRSNPAFFVFTAPSSGSFTISGVPAPGEPQVAWFALHSAEHVMMKMSTCMAVCDPPITADLTAGTTYYLEVGRYGDLEPGWLTITARGPGIPDVHLSLKEWAPSAAAQSTSVAVTVLSGGSWSASTSMFWLSASQDNATTMLLSVRENPGAARSGLVTVRSSGETATLLVTQSAAGTTTPTPDPTTPDPTTPTPDPTTPTPDPTKASPSPSTSKSSASPTPTKPSSAPTSSRPTPSVSVPPLLEKIKAGVVKITGPARVGKTLKAKVTKFTKGVAYSYTWYRNGSKIKGATKASYTLKKADRGKKIKVTVTAKKTGMLPASATSKVVKVSKK
ncbi:MAG: BACON domain-containing protein [Micrococcales bacterium]|nr:BACON domain-containing protein [Micrococcales bacterium]